MVVHVHCASIKCKTAPMLPVSLTCVRVCALAGMHQTHARTINTRCLAYTLLLRALNNDGQSNARKGAKNDRGRQRTDPYLDAVIGLPLLVQTVQQLAHVGVERVERLGPVQGRDASRPLGLREHLVDVRLFWDVGGDCLGGGLGPNRRGEGGGGGGGGVGF